MAGVQLIYATSDETNVPMHLILVDHGFRLEGLPYASNLKTPDIKLFIRTT
jgi:hypothetical protein